MVDDAYSEAVEFSAGCTACAGGQLRSSNPHAVASRPWSAWQRGWMHEFHRLPPMLQGVRLRKEPDLLNNEPIDTGQDNG